MSDLTYAKINLDNLTENYGTLKRMTGDCRVICVVKADAYGHGVIPVVRRLRNLGASFFAVANLSEALQVRAATRRADILILGYTDPRCADILVENNITQAIISKSYATKLASAAMSTRKQKPVLGHLALNCGMNRVGIDCTDRGVNEASAVLALPGLRINGIFSHLSCADTPNSEYTDKQIAAYNKTVEAIEAKCGKFAINHLCNSAALMQLPCQNQDAVRAGIMLYGLKSTPDTPPLTKPVMELWSTVTHIAHVCKGQPISYGAAFVTERPSRIATVAVGYADGFRRAYAGDVIIPSAGGARAPIVGRICMDMLMIDVTDIPGVTVGTDVMLFGSSGITADDVAARADTIGYEVVTGISKRVPRVYN